jgi:hypothetical protein
LRLAVCALVVCPLASENGVVTEGSSHRRADCFEAKRHAMTDEPVAVACPRDTNQKHLRFGAKQIRLERSNTTLAVSDGTLDRLKRLLLTFRDKPLREESGKTSGRELLRSV